MEPKTIVFILLALAVIAYYTDPFGWDPSGRFGGKTYGAIGRVHMHVRIAKSFQSFDSEFAEGRNSLDGVDFMAKA